MEPRRGGGVSPRVKQQIGGTRIEHLRPTESRFSPLRWVLQWAHGSSAARKPPEDIRDARGATAKISVRMHTAVMRRRERESVAAR